MKNSVKLQDIKSINKNQLCFNTLIMNYQRNQENDPIYNCIKKNKISINKFNQGGERLNTEKYKILMKETEKETNKW